jgi:hypothetical protein
MLLQSKAMQHRATHLTPASTFSLFRSSVARRVLHQLLLKGCGIRKCKSAVTVISYRLYILSFLSDRIVPAQSSILDAPIVLEEVQTAVKKIPKGRTPGPDGIPLEF